MFEYCIFIYKEIFMQCNICEKEIRNIIRRFPAIQENPIRPLRSFGLNKFYDRYNWLSEMRMP